MGVGIGMRGIDLRTFLRAAQTFNVIILVRQTNADSLKYIGKPGYYPKPAACKAKTADKNVSAKVLVQGRPQTRTYDVAGLVVHPGFQPAAYKDGKAGKAHDYWDNTMHVLSPSLMGMGRKVDPNNPNTWSMWGIERQGVHAPNWMWRVDINPSSKHFGCLQLLKRAHADWCYIHGDYDLKDVIVARDPITKIHNDADTSKLDGVPNKTPVLLHARNIPPAFYGREFEFIKTWLNLQMGVEMVQHGAEAQFAWHGDEAITVAHPDGRHEILYDGATVQSWYMNLKRNVLAKKGDDYRVLGTLYAGPGGLTNIPPAPANPPKL